MPKNYPATGAVIRGRDTSTMIRADRGQLEQLQPSDHPEKQPFNGRVRALFLSQTSAGFRTYARQLREYAAARDDVEAVFIDLPTPRWMAVLGKSIPRLRDRGWDLHSYRHLVLWRRALLSAIRRGVLDLNHFDAVHVMTQGAALFLNDIRPRCSATLLVNIDGTAQQDVDHFGFSALARKPFIRAERIIFRAVDRVVSRNHFAPQSLERDYHLPPEKILIARSSMKLPPRSRWDQPENRKGPVQLIYVGNDAQRKGLPELLRAHQQQFADRAELHVVTNENLRLAGLSRVVVHRGVDRAQLLNELLPMMDLFVLWTRRDHQPWAILEAASVGLPVVSTRVAAVPDMVIHGKTGYLASPGDWAQCIEYTKRLIDDASLRQRFGVAAREHVRAVFDPEKEFHRLFDQLRAVEANH